MVSNDRIMKKPKKAPKKVIKRFKEIDESGLSPFRVEEAAIAYALKKPEKKEDLKSFKVTIAGKQKTYPVQEAYGYFIPSFKKAESLGEVSQWVERGLPSKEIKSIIDYLGFTVPDIAKAASVSTSTVSRWAPDTSIGAPGSNQFFKIDEVIRKGVKLFGGEAEFKSWLNNPNLALGNAVPSNLITSLIEIDLVDEALDALNYGNVM